MDMFLKRNVEILFEQLDRLDITSEEYKVMWHSINIVKENISELEKHHEERIEEVKTKIDSIDVEYYSKEMMRLDTALEKSRDMQSMLK